jgi:hypothetical protein
VSRSLSPPHPDCGFGATNSVHLSRLFRSCEGGNGRWEFEGNMPHVREVNTCDRCRHLKRRCDKTKPTCSRCAQTGFHCSFDTSSSSSRSASELPSPLTALSLSSLTGWGQIEAPPQGLSAIEPGLGEKIVRKRNRACLSCVRCHRLKVRCDKRLPCARCKTTGFSETCSYTNRAAESVRLLNTTSSGVPFVGAGENPATILSTWHSRHRGSSHWKNLLLRVSVFTEVWLFGINS